MQIAYRYNDDNNNNNNTKTIIMFICIASFFHLSACNLVCVIVHFLKDVQFDLADWVYFFCACESVTCSPWNTSLISFDLMTLIATSYWRGCGAPCETDTNGWSIQQQHNQRCWSVCSRVPVSPEVRVQTAKQWCWPQALIQQLLVAPKVRCWYVG